jgi:hypothetical protein
VKAAGNLYESIRGSEVEKTSRDQSRYKAPEAVIEEEESIIANDSQ